MSSTQNPLAGDRANTRYDATHPHGRPGAGPTEELVRVAAVCVLNSVGQLLVGLSTKRACWDVPQGVAEDGESPVDAAVRELREETGLSYLPHQLAFMGTFRHRTPEFAYPFENHLYLVEDSSPATVWAKNLEPAKCERLLWVAPCQVPCPRALSLRLALALLGRSE